MSLLSSWDKMDVPVKLLADYVWAAEDDKTVLLSVEVDSFNHFFFLNNQFPSPWYKLGPLNENMVKVEKLINVNQIILMGAQNILFDRTLST